LLDVLPDLSGSRLHWRGEGTQPGTAFRL